MVRDEIKKHPDFGERFCRWVGEKRLAEGAQVRQLSAVLSHAEARKQFEETDPEAAFDYAMRTVEQADPEQGSPFFKLLRQLRESCTSAAQVKEILRIRVDPVARSKVVETYEAFQDFMRLADIDPENPDAHDERDAA